MTRISLMTLAALSAGLIGLVATATGAAAQGATAQARVTVNPGPTSRTGFHICVGTASNRAAYGSATTGSDGTATFHVPAGTVQVTVVKAGYKGNSAVAFTSAGQTSTATIAVEPGTAVFSCPGYTPPATSAAPTTRDLTVTVTDGGRPVSGAYVCVGSSSQPEKLARTRQTNSAGQVTFADLPANEPWAVLAGTAGRRNASAIAAPHNADRTMSLALASGTSPVCPGTPAPPPLNVAVTTARTIGADVPATRQEYVINGTVAWSYAKKYGFTFVPARAEGSNDARVFGPLDGVATWLAVFDPDAELQGCVRVPNVSYSRQCIVSQVVGGNMSVLPPQRGLTAQTAEFEMFGGKRLSPGWTVKTVSISNGTFMQQPTSGSNNLFFKLKLSSHAPNGATSVVQSVKLEGPVGANPEDAFRNSQN